MHGQQNMKKRLSLSWFWRNLSLKTNFVKNSNNKVIKIWHTI